MALPKTAANSAKNRSTKRTFEELESRRMMAGDLALQRILTAMGPVEYEKTSANVEANSAATPKTAVTFVTASSFVPALAQVSRAVDGTAWAIGTNQQVYRLENTSWKQVLGIGNQPAPTLKQISVGSQNKIFGVNAADQVFRWDGTQFSQMPGGLTQVSVAADGTAWGINSNQHVFRFQGNVWSQIVAPNPANAAPTLKQISVGSSNLIWGVNAANQVFRWDGSQFTAVQPASATLVQVSIAADGTAWGLNSDQHVFRHEANSWNQVVAPIAGQPAPTLKQISVSSSNVIWGVNAANQVFRWDGTQFTGDLAPTNSASAPPLVQVAIALDNTAWGIGTNQEVYRLRDNAWSQVLGEAGQPAPTLKQISVGSANDIYGVNAANQVFRWNGTRFDQMPGGLTQVSVGADGTAWGINSNQHVFRYQGGVWGQVLASNPVNPAPTLKHISVGSKNNIWGVSATSSLYAGNQAVRLHIDFDTVGHVSSGLVQVSVGADGTAWGINHLQHIYRYVGNQWVQVEAAVSGQPAPTLKQISVASSTLIWGVNASNQVFRWDGTQFTGDLKRQPEVVRVQGSGSKDRIFVSQANGWITVQGAELVGKANPRRIEARLVSRIEVVAGPGNDLIDLRGLTIGADVYGGSGDDIAYGGSGNDKLYGEEGVDTMYGLGGDDQLFGGQNRDFLYGGTGNDGLFGGAQVSGINTRDFLFGEDGDDRFLAHDNVALQDKRHNDVQIDFVNSTSKSINHPDFDSTGGTQQNWQDIDIETIDSAFALLQSHTGSVRLLKDTDYSDDLQFYKFVSTDGNLGVNATKDNWREILINDWDERDASENAELILTVIHEIGHNWDEPLSLNRAKKNFGNTIDEFRNLSKWEYTAADKLWDSHNAKSGFANEHGTTNPFEDWATSLERFFAHLYFGVNKYEDLEGNNANFDKVAAQANFDKKLDKVKSFLRIIATLK